MEHNIFDYMEREGRNYQDLVVIPPISKVVYGSKWHSFKNQTVEDLSCREITITFKEELYRKYKNEYISQALRKWCNRRRNKTTVLLIPDYSKTFRLHYHGYIWGEPKDVENFRKGSSRLWGRTEVKYILYPSTYFDYVFGLYTPEYTNPHKVYDHNAKLYIHDCIETNNSVLKNLISLPIV